MTWVAAPASVETLRELFTYGYWARDRQLGACDGLPPGAILRPPVSGVPSLRDTLVEMIADEWLWLQRWLGGHPTRKIAPDDFTSTAAIRERWRKIEAEVLAFLSRLDDEDLARAFRFTDLDRTRHTFRLGDTILHLLHDQIERRGQVNLLLRQLGGTAPSLDYTTSYLASLDMPLV